MEVEESGIFEKYILPRVRNKNIVINYLSHGWVKMNGTDKKEAIRIETQRLRCARAD